MWRWKGFGAKGYIREDTWTWSEGGNEPSAGDAYRRVYTRAPTDLELKFATDQVWVCTRISSKKHRFTWVEQGPGLSMAVPFLWSGHHSVVQQSHVQMRQISWSNVVKSSSVQNCTTVGICISCFFLVFSCLPWEDLCGSLIVCIRTSDRADRADRAPGKTSFKGRCTCCTAPKFVQGFLWRLPSLFCATSWTGKTWSRRLCREVGKKQVSAEWVHSCPFSGKGSFMWKWTSWSLILEHVVRTFDPVGIYLFLCLCRDNLGQTGLCACVVWVPICVPVYVEAASLCHSSGSCEEVCATFARAANWSLLPACWAFRQCTAWHSCNFDMLWAPMNINEHKSKLHFEGICFSLNILRRESSKTESNLRQIHS